MQINNGGSNVYSYKPPAEASNEDPCKIFEKVNKFLNLLFDLEAGQFGFDRKICT
jgi:hypothetical protein